MDKKSLWAGLALGLGAGWLARGLAPTVAPWVRPAAKNAMKVAVLGFERTREVAAAWAEDIEDTIAEVRSELEKERGAPPPGNDA